MFFYELCAYGFEESYDNIYLSDKEYGQEEFEDIIFKSYEKLCYNILKEKETSPCFQNIFFDIEFSIFSNEFDKILEEDYGLFRVNHKKVKSRICFDLTNESNKYNDMIDDIRYNLDFDMSCYDNDCSRIVDKDVKEDRDFRRNCLVSSILKKKKNK